MADPILKVVRFPTQLAQDNGVMAAKLRGLADDIESGGYGAVESMVILMEDETGLISRNIFANTPMDNARYVGLLAFAMAKITNGA